VATTNGAPQPATTLAGPTTTSTPSKPITSSKIVSISIPAIGLKAKASGGISPAESERCEGNGVAKCYDPPSLTEVAWGELCALPSLPSSDTVCLFGHSNRFYPDRQVFNNLHKLHKGDSIVVTTDTAVFTYLVDKRPVEVHFEKIGTTGWVWAKVPDRLVAITCAIGASSYTGAYVVEAMLDSVGPLS
jgi:hypothetical protein